MLFIAICFAGILCQEAIADSYAFPYYSHIYNSMEAWQDGGVCNFAAYYPPHYQLMVEQEIVQKNRAKDIVIKMERRLDEQAIHEGQVHHTIY